MVVKDKVVIITGASSGIGEATARILAEKGAKVVLAARREEKLQILSKELGDNVIYKVTDVTRMVDLEALAHFTLAQFGKIDVLVNSAGLSPFSNLIDKHVSEWDAMIDINLKGTLYGIGAVLPYLVAQQSGQIINLSSIAGHVAHSGSAVYSATKFAVRALSDSLREEMDKAHTKVRVTVISPGWTDTPITQSITDEKYKASTQKAMANSGMPVERVANTIVEAINLPEDSEWNEVILKSKN